MAHLYLLIEMVASGRKCPIHISSLDDECMWCLGICELSHNISQIGSIEELMCEYEESNCT